MAVIKYNPFYPCSRCGTDTYTGGWCMKCGLYKPSRPPRRAEFGETELGERPIAHRILDGCNLAARSGDELYDYCEYCGEPWFHCQCQDSFR